MGTLSGEQTLLFSFLLPLSDWGQLFKEKKLIRMSKIFPLRKDPFIEGRVLSPRDANSKFQKLCPLVKVAEKHGSVSFTLRNW